MYFVDGKTTFYSNLLNETLDTDDRENERHVWKYEHQ